MSGLGFRSDDTATTDVLCQQSRPEDASGLVHSTSQPELPQEATQTSLFRSASLEEMPWTPRVSSQISPGLGSQFGCGGRQLATPRSPPVVVYSPQVGRRTCPMLLQRSPIERSRTVSHDSSPISGCLAYPANTNKATLASVGSRRF